MVVWFAPLIELARRIPIPPRANTPPVNRVVMLITW